MTKGKGYALLAFTKMNGEEGNNEHSKEYRLQRNVHRHR